MRTTLRSTLRWAPCALALTLLPGCAEETTCDEACVHLGRCTLAASDGFDALKAAACGPGVDACEERGPANAGPYDVNTAAGRGVCVIGALGRLAAIQRPEDAALWQYLDDEEFCKAVELVLSGQLSKEHVEPYKRACEGSNPSGLTDNCTYVYDRLTTGCKLSLPPKS